MLPTVFRNGSTYAPAAPIEGVFNRLMNLDHAFGEDGAAWAGTPVSIWHDEDHAYVELELPGVAESDVEMTLHRNELTIVAERKAPEGRKYLYSGRKFGKIRRQITLPEDVNSEGVEAKLEGGVLTVSLPKRAEAKPRKIALKSN